MSETLRDAVEAVARAQIAQDHAVFASYMTPQALLALRGGTPVRARSFEVSELVEREGTGRSTVEFRGWGRYVLSMQWERMNGRWRAISAAIPPEDIRPPIWNKIRGLLGLGVESA